ncbi:PREDICTED: bcl-2-interacting killer [Chinchilla lanigera]|uniref:bcl-2-interacting killer n=1 Tax=Chinchilla lanigera TaxID=34839 RepID=UPI0006987D82|nr:PREDICTED: bcl-2-interacting killer [Chinchilla lanigera]
MGRPRCPGQRAPPPWHRPHATSGTGFDLGVWSWHRHSPGVQDMSEARPVTRDPLMEAPPYEPLPGPLLAEGALGVTQPLRGEDLGPPGDTNLVGCLEGSSLVALRLACIGDEMDLRLRGPRLAQLPGRAVHSLAVAYSQTGLWGVLRRLTCGLTSLRDVWAWGRLVSRAWVSPGRACRRLLPVLLLLLLLGTLRRLLQ